MASAYATSDSSKRFIAFSTSARPVFATTSEG
jgi:hypothetical protein